MQEEKKDIVRYMSNEKEYKRFKADSKRTNKANSTIEYLHCLIKRRITND